MQNKVYGVEFKAAIVAEYIKGENGYKTLARKYGVPRDTIRSWVLSKSCYKNKAPALTMTDKEKRELDYYKTAAIFWKNYAKNCEKEIAKESKKKLKMQTVIETKKTNVEIKTKTLLKIAKIPKSNYYRLKDNEGKKLNDIKVIELIHKLPKLAVKNAGSKTKSKMILQNFGIRINHKRIARICKENALLSDNRAKKHPKDYYSNKQKDNENKPKNILNREFFVDKPLTKLVTDVSYFKTKKGWLYLSVFMDLYNRKIVSYSLSKSNNLELVMSSLNNLKSADLKGMLIHSDQGCLYSSIEYKKFIKDHQIIQSMSRKANCWDNSCIEHFFGTLKVESGYNKTLKTSLLNDKETSELIDEYIYYYNNQRIQKDLGWKTPNSFAS